MVNDLPLFPERATAAAGRVDLLYFFLIGVSLFFIALIFGLIVYFCVKYRRRPANLQSTQVKNDVRLELAWTGIPLALTMVMFVWGAKLFFQDYNAPPDALEIFVVAKQWMWKFQQPDGHREINDLHVPLGRPVKLTMISEDVIHDLFVPAFRVKKDVLPGRYTSIWFNANRAGQYHFFCSQYCGTEHSKMGGWVTVMEPADYARWLSGATTGESLPVAGGRLFQQLGCATCHLPDNKGRGPSLVGLMGKHVKLQTGETVVADADYIRACILHPATKIVAGYQPIMPTFKGIISEEGLQQIIAYIESEGAPQP